VQRKKRTPEPCPYLSVAISRKSKVERKKKGFVGQLGKRLFGVYFTISREKVRGGKEHSMTGWNKNQSRKGKDTEQNNGPSTEN